MASNLSPNASNERSEKLEFEKLFAVKAQLTVGSFVSPEHAAVVLQSALSSIPKKDTAINTNTPEFAHFQGQLEAYRRDYSPENYRTAYNKLFPNDDAPDSITRPQREPIGRIYAGGSYEIEIGENKARAANVQVEGVLPEPAHPRASYCGSLTLLGLGLGGGAASYYEWQMDRHRSATEQNYAFGGLGASGGFVVAGLAGIAKTFWNNHYA
jgi:hypothetical protein